MGERLTSELLQEHANAYFTKLVGFVEANNVADLLVVPVDHLAVKARDSLEYEELIKMIKPLSLELSYVEMDGRRLATAKLKTEVLFGDLGGSSFLELMEPRPGKEGVGFCGLDKGLEHIEIFADLGKVRELLKRLGIIFEEQKNPNHKAVVLQINPEGQEVKFTDSRLGEIVAKQLQTGESKLIS